ncbi:site-specific integrase [Paraburkholderia sediminicola]|uniref:site-specific integrase n=1 Tax=Paraburkholderia sediminicola TaxID=458836 RepID=UPI0038B832ED
MYKRQSHSSSSNFAALLQEFFVERLMQQRAVSPQTIASYRDTFRLFLQFAQARLRKSPVDLALADINVDLVLAFLRHLEDNRHNCARTRNSRLVAIRSFLKYAALKDISSLAVIQSTLAIPMKRFDRPLIGHLSRDEIEALLAAPDPNTWCGQRDRVLFATLYNTGARVSELIGLRVGDVVLDKAPCAHIHGKGRKQRTVPLWRSTASQIRSWLPRIRSSPDQILFPNRSGNPMTRSNVTDRLKLAARTATRQCPQLSSHPISPHVIRHSTGTHLLQSGVDLSVIALWLGHESPATTHMYVEADLAMKERALNTLQPPHSKIQRYRPPDRLMQFLESL